tara:strand:- start:220 stop:348 length:129 start_codon:yes stop_codon:yes gene_type:complete
MRAELQSDRDPALAAIASRAVSAALLLLATLPHSESATAEKK